MKVGVLALQGAFIEHEKKLEKLGVECIELRQKKDLERVCQEKCVSNLNITKK
ncbi:hypothetical protein GT484_14275 [Coprobacillus sp. BIOML-A1]|nr:hypothetical protein [Coprobacillus sp. BIOML-A1]